VEAPVLIVEVQSDSTESYDRGVKFEHYRALLALRHYLLLSQRRLQAELYTRTDPASWRFQETSGDAGGVVLDVWGVELPLDELYRNVELGEGETTASGMFSE
jgi:Uma2 family endonuclease